jgi:diguanylate cyclase (GGDEF)-like protein
MPSLPPEDVASHGHVLVVDDDRTTRSFLQVQLEDAGFDVTMAATGERCLELAMNVLPEVIVLDMTMPGMDGIETCRRLRAAAATHDIPILFLTGMQDDERVVVRALEAGANDFVAKDSSRHVLAARLRTQVQISRAHYKMRELSLVDEVSGAWSKAYLRSGARHAVKAMTRPRRQTLACVVADVDGIEEVNKRHGFRAGDDVLRIVASCLLDVTRETDVVARLDGARYGVLMIDTDLEGAQPLMHRMMDMVQQRVKLATISFGVAVLDGIDVITLKKGAVVDELVDDLISRAVVAARKAVREGEGSVVVDDGADGEPSSIEPAPVSEPTVPRELPPLPSRAPSSVPPTSTPAPSSLPPPAPPPRSARRPSPMRARAADEENTDTGIEVEIDLDDDDKDTVAVTASSQPPASSSATPHDDADDEPSIDDASEASVDVTAEEVDADAVPEDAAPDAVADSAQTPATAGSREPDAAAGDDANDDG